MILPFTCAPTSTFLIGATVPVASTVLTMSVRVMGANRYLGPSFFANCSPQPAIAANTAAKKNFIVPFLLETISSTPLL